MRNIIIDSDRITAGRFYNADGGTGAGVIDAEHDGNGADDGAEPQDIKHSTVGLPVDGGTGNPYNSLFEGVVFDLVSSEREYTDGRGGSSKKIANAAVILRGGFATATAQLRATKSASGGVRLEFAFIGNMARQTSIVPVDAESKGHFTRWRAAASVVGREWYRKIGGGKKGAAEAATAVQADDLNLF